MYTPTKEYFVKALIRYTGRAPVHIGVYKTRAKNSEAAANNVSNLIESWDMVDAYWILRTSVNPIELTSYDVQVLVNYQTKSNTIKLRLQLENPAEAKEVFGYLSEDWNSLVSFEILSTTKINMPYGRERRK